MLKAESRRAYQACAQSTYESIVVFKERFDDLLDSYEEHGNPEMDPDDVAMDFYRALDNSRYAAFKTSMVNNINSVPSSSRLPSTRCTRKQQHF